MKNYSRSVPLTIAAVFAALAMAAATTDFAQPGICFCIALGASAGAMALVFSTLTRKKALTRKRGMVSGH